MTKLRGQEEQKMKTLCRLKDEDEFEYRKKRKILQVEK